MNKDLEEFLLNKKETLATTVKKQFADVMEDRLARMMTKETVSITTAAVAGLTIATFATALLMTGLKEIAQQNFGDGPEHKPSEPLMAEYLSMAGGLHALSLYEGDRKHTTLDQKTLDAVSKLTGAASPNIQSLSDAGLEKLLLTEAESFSNQAFADMRLSEKDLATLHSASGLKMTYSYSGAYMRNECAEKGLTNVQSCMKDPDMITPRGFESLLGMGILASFGFAAFGAYRVTYKKVEEKLDVKLPGHPDRPRQAKFDFG